MMNERYGSSRLNSLLESGKVDNSRLMMLDCYNQAVYEDIACTITTRINSCNHYYISEPMPTRKQDQEHNFTVIPPCIWQMGYGTSRPIGPYHDGLSPTITSSQWEANNVLIEEMPDYEYKTMPNGNIRAYSPRRGDGKGVNGYHITNPDNVHPTLTSAHEPLIMEQTTEKIIEPQSLTRERMIAEPIKSDYVGEDADKVRQTADELCDYVQQHKPGTPIGVDIQPDGHLRPHVANESDFGIMDYYTDHERGTAGTQIATRPSKVYEESTNYRIRRLTPRECFRLMDVDEWAIDRILHAKGKKGKRVISNSQAYKMAGNSIVTSCLVAIFRRMFIDTAPTKPYQMSLFD